MGADPFTAADRTALADAAGRVATSGLVVGSSGNLSLRREDHLLITPTGARLERLDPADCVCVPLGAGPDEPGTGPRPSSELGLHRAVYRAVPGARAVVHTHSHFATVMSTLVPELPAIHYVAASFGGSVRVAPYATFGTVDLAEGVANAIRDRTAVLMANHGALATGSSIAAAVEQALHLEWLASVVWHARMFGAPALLDDEQLASVAEQSRTLGYGMATA